MAITPVASTTHNELDPTTSCTLTIPAGTQADDIIVIGATNRNAAADLSVSDDDTGGNAPALLMKQLADTDNRSGQVWWKRATSGSAGMTITIAGATNSVAAGLTVYRGADTGATPWEAAAGEKNASGDETQAAITVSDGSMVCLFIFNTLNDITPSSQACTDPGALTERFNALSAGGSDCGVNHASALKSGAGGTGAFTWAQADNIGCSIAFGLKAAATAAGGMVPFLRRDHPALFSQVRR